MGGALVDGQRNPYGKTVRLANTITHQLDEFGLSFVGGSVARVMETCGDIDIVFLPTEENSLAKFDIWCEERDIKQNRTIRRGVVEGIQIDIWIASKDNVVTYVNFANGSGWFNGALRSRAKRMGMKLSQNGLFREEELLVGPCKHLDKMSIALQENEVFETLGMTFVPLQERSAENSRQAFGIIGRFTK
jgi:DNA polymerase (family X)